MKKITFYFFVLIAVSTLLLSAFSQLQRYSFHQIDSLQKVSKKNIVVFIHTSWCTYCQSMQNTTFEDSNIVRLLNEKFLFVDLDAEEKKDILFSGHTFKYRPTGTSTGVHELAEQLGSMDGRVSYPTLSILNPAYEIIFQHNSFLSSADLSNVLKTVLKNQRTRND